MRCFPPCRPLVLVLTLWGGLAQAGAAPDMAPRPRPAGVSALEPADAPGEAQCTADGAACVRAASYTADVCRLIEAAARDAAIDQNFFARLLWKESLFDAAAVSPAGAQGIAQFMPETAKLRGLADAFNPAEALYASAHYLAELSRDYGNIGLAAAAYNGGEARADRFVTTRDALPAETRAYVAAITGVPAETWRDAPPATVDLALDKTAAFQTACVAYAATRGAGAFRSGPPPKPWGVLIASNRARDGLKRQVARLKNRYSSVLKGEAVSYGRSRRPGTGRLETALLGRESRAEAEALCGRLRAAGADCLVQRN